MGDGGKIGGKSDWSSLRDGQRGWQSEFFHERCDLGKEFGRNVFFSIFLSRGMVHRRGFYFLNFLCTCERRFVFQEFSFYSRFRFFFIFSESISGFLEASKIRMNILSTYSIFLRTIRVLYLYILLKFCNKVSRFRGENVSIRSSISQFLHQLRSLLRRGSRFEEENKGVTHR